MKRAFFTCGLPGSGKGAVSDYILGHQIPRVVMGDVVRDHARDALGEDASSHEIGVWAGEQREEHGDEYFAKKTLDRINEKFDSLHYVCIDGMRNRDEFDYFARTAFQPTIFHITAPFETRLTRLQNRGREDESTFTARDLAERDRTELEALGFQSLRERFDTNQITPVTISNTGTLDDLHAAVDPYLPPFPEPPAALREALMGAYDELEETYGRMTPRDINEGLCREFAREVLDRVSGLEAELTAKSMGFHHTWIEYDGACYDATCMQRGVPEPGLLPVFQDNSWSEFDPEMVTDTILRQEP